MAVEDMALRNHGAVVRLSHDMLTHTRHFVLLNAVGHTLNYAVELNLTSELTHDHGVERIPRGNHVAFLNHVAFFEEEVGTVWHVHS